MSSFMNIAISEAIKALNSNEVPVGAIIVKDRKIIAKAYNMKETLYDPTAHAEILAIREATRHLKNWRLNGCSMYVTLEPCAMCAGAIINARISDLYIGTFDPRAGACGSVMNVVQNQDLNHWVNVNWLYDKECSKLLLDFFKAKR